MATAAKEVTEKPPPWRNSYAKEVLKEDIIEGHVTESMDPDVVYESRPCLFKLYKRSNFKTNLKNLFKRIKKDKDRASMDLAAFLHDMSIRPQSEGPGYEQWQGSEAEVLLKEDLKHDGVSMKPEQLWQS